jgi:hypothetical protein
MTMPAGGAAIQLAHAYGLTAAPIDPLFVLTLGIGCVVVIYLWATT